MNSSNFDFNMLRYQQNLQILDVAENYLKYVDLTFLPSTLKELYLDGNDLTRLGIFLKSRIWNLVKLSLSKNQFSCQYLRRILPKLTEKWPNLEYIGDP